MPEDLKSAPQESEPTAPAEAVPPQPDDSQQKPPETTQQEKDQEIGDFITRHVLEKDSVFFEG